MAQQRIVSEPFFADVMQDTRDPSLWVYVVQRHGSDEILSLGTCTDREQCAEMAATVLEQFTAAEADRSHARVRLDQDLEN